MIYQDLRPHCFTDNFVLFLVSVHYNVRLQEGGYFDSSQEKGAPFKFKLGQCMYLFFFFESCFRVSEETLDFEICFDR